MLTSSYSSPHFLYTLPRQKCMDSNLRMYSLTQKLFRQKIVVEVKVVCIVIFGAVPWEHRNWNVQDKQKMNKGQD